jgi:hypothetical protein
MPTLNQYEPFVQCFRVIDERLLFQCGPGGLLDGVKYDFEGTLEARGARDFPYIQPTAYSDLESIGPGANQSQTGALPGASPHWDIQSFAFWVFARRSNGLYSRERSPSIGKMGIMQLVARVRDAVETRADGSGMVDRRLEGRCATNLKSSVTQNEIGELGWGALLEFEVQTDTYCAGGRTRIV